MGIIALKHDLVPRSKLRCTIGIMNLLIALYFFILATIQLGLLLGIYHYYRAQKLIRPSTYWMSSLVVSVVGLFVFGFGIVSIEDIAKPELNFTIANTLFYVAAVLQLFFCLSLNGRVTKVLKIAFTLSLPIFMAAFEWMRVYGTFEIRTTTMCGLTIIFYLWQMFQIRYKRDRAPSQQLTYLQYVTGAELFFAVGRIAILIASSLTLHSLQQIPQLLILFTIAQLVMNTLSYIAIGGYWAERIAIAIATTETKNEKITELLRERDSLIRSLLKANKTAATGALSASIAHELNQPLGSSSLNIQYLQKKLSEGTLTTQLQHEILDLLLKDNRRAAIIIQSLRTIFSEGVVSAEGVDLSEIIASVLAITKPEVRLRNIQIVLDIDPLAHVFASKNELMQVALNLFNNASQAIEDSEQQQGRICISAKLVHDGVQLTISDNGPGVAPEAQPRLFELLSTGRRSGMGLGLWLCKHIVGRHGGEITYSDAIGGGAQFTIFFPANPSPETS